MKKPTEEQIQIFWEWCGFYQDATKEWDGDGYYVHTGWYSPNKKECCGLPDIDLNNLFKYAVPKLSMYELNSYNNDGIHSAWISLELDGWHKCATSQDPALALFWAIYGVIESEQLNNSKRNIE